jgi:hypothetical protein
MSESRGDEAKENEGICSEATHGKTKHGSDKFFSRKKKVKTQTTAKGKGNNDIR